MQKTNLLKKLLYVIILIFGDFAAFSLSFALAFYTRKYIGYLFLLPKFIVYGYLSKLFWLPLVYFFFFSIEGLYTKKVHFWYELKILFKAIFIAFIVCLSIVSIGKLTDFVSRLFLFFLLFYSLIVFPIFRVALKNLLFFLGISGEKVLLIGISPTSVKFAQSFNNNKYLCLDIVGFVNKTKEHINGFKTISPLTHAKKITKALGIDIIIIDENALSEEEVSKLFKELQALVKRIILIPKMSFIFLLNSQVNYLFVEKIFVLSVNNNLKSFLNRFLKRIFDLCISIILLPFLIIIILIISVAIKLDSKGSVFYVSKRLGQNGKLFNFLKFRTMYKDNDRLLKEYLSKNKEARLEWEKYQKLKNFDPRVTRIGRFLRKTSLDELPQIINVLFGQMSLVGPRPYLPQELEKIGDSINTILLTKPGITGLWQVSGRNELDFQTRVDLDCFYVTNWSLWFDIVILLKTIYAVLKQKGAY
ncbi:undecaprenyl-phosphate galactose phosphotransferase [Desulfurella multipotens]|uniref:Undecaprenyl-phosphate galactose phosphotransferase n=2 Tax=Desulfurella TaxID=33001 RepID=A0A1G6QU00_9BACT|nr:undecaprenyl-phosphate galactose phosphotransferase WbaP [Desulfurella multipotens]SDC95812.1 undecaprenyl-phosphate galactose phosphotransferase [Desulfurella multipotens]